MAEVEISNKFTVGNGGQIFMSDLFFFYLVI